MSDLARSDATSSSTLLTDLAEMLERVDEIERAHADAERWTLRPLRRVLEGLAAGDQPVPPAEIVCTECPPSSAAVYGHRWPGYVVDYYQYVRCAEVHFYYASSLRLSLLCSALVFNVYAEYESCGRWHFDTRFTICRWFLSDGRFDETDVIAAVRGLLWKFQNTRRIQNAVGRVVAAREVPK